MTSVRITYDEVANAAYIHLGPHPGGAWVARSYPCDPVAVDGVINLDFDATGRLGGIEVLDARTKLSPALLALAENITEAGE